MNNYVVSAAVALITSTPAFAQEITYANVELGFGTFTLEDENATVGTLGGEFEYQVNQLFFGATLSYGQQSIADSEITFKEYGVQVGYMPITGVMVGVEYQLVTQSFSTPLSDNEFSGSITGLFGQYDGAQFDVALTYSQSEFEGMEGPSQTSIFGRTSVSPDVMLLAVVNTYEGQDGSNYQLGARYDTGQIDAVASYSSNTESGFGFLEVEGACDINEKVAAFARYSRSTGTDSDQGFLNLVFVI